MGRLPNLARDTRGATAVEYGLIDKVLTHRG